MYPEFWKFYAKSYVRLWHHQRSIATRTITGNYFSNITEQISHNCELRTTDSDRRNCNLWLLQCHIRYFDCRYIFRRITFWQLRRRNFGDDSLIGFKLLNKFNRKKVWLLGSRLQWWNSAHMENRWINLQVKRQGRSFGLCNSNKWSLDWRARWA